MILQLVIVMLSVSPRASQQIRDLPKRSVQENFACMVGHRTGDSTLYVDSLAPSTQGTCNSISHVVGMIHSHPTDSRCWYYFPGTTVKTADAYAAEEVSPYPIDAIACWYKLIWIGKDGQQHSLQV